MWQILQNRSFKIQVKCYVNNTLLHRYTSKCFPFQKQPEKQELLHVKMETPLLCRVASDNSSPDFTATEDRIVDHRTVLLSGGSWHRIWQTLKGQEEKCNCTYQRDAH